MSKEIEVHFLEINKEKIIKKLHSLGAKDLGENLLEEILFDTEDEKLNKENRAIRLRSIGDRSHILTYKHYKEERADSLSDVEEIEIKISDPDKIIEILEKLGYKPYRRQEKYRHSFIFNDCEVEIDTWPEIPSYLEIEGKSEKKIKETSELLGFDYNNGYFASAGMILYEKYGIPIRTLRTFTFEDYGK